MIESAHYCEECSKKLSPETAQTYREKDFIKAREWRSQDPIDYSKAARTVYGICDGCGLVAVVDFYEISQ